MRRLSDHSPCVCNPFVLNEHSLRPKGCVRDDAGLEPGQGSPASWPREHIHKQTGDIANAGVLFFGNFLLDKQKKVARSRWKQKNTF